MDPVTILLSSTASSKRNFVSHHYTGIQMLKQRRAHFLRSSLSRKNTIFPEEVLFELGREVSVF